MPFPPAPPAAASPPTERPKTAAEQYQSLKHFLPLSEDPGTPKPHPGDLKVHVRLRVEWGKGWWAARVKDERPDSVKIGYDTWSTDHDEWIPRDSARLRLGVPGEQDAAAEPEVGTPMMKQQAFVAGLPSKDRAYVPKPYNPEKEFQKRQLRLQEKIAAMQKVKVGEVDPSLLAIQALRRGGGGETAPVEAGSVSGQGAAPSSAADFPPPPPGAVPAAPAAAAAAAAPIPAAASSGFGDPAAAFVPPPAPGYQVPSSAGMASAHFGAAAAADDAAAASGAFNSTAAQVTEEISALADSLSGSAPAQAGGAKDSTSAGQPVASAAMMPGMAPEVDAPSAASAAVRGGAEPSAAQAAASSSESVNRGSQGGSNADSAQRGALRWEELLSDSKERYYHEIATGRTQWELPVEGWVELVADDGGRYYWNAVTNTTTWTQPVP